MGKCERTIRNWKKDGKIKFIKHKYEITDEYGYVVKRKSISIIEVKDVEALRKKIVREKTREKAKAYRKFFRCLQSLGLTNCPVKKTAAIAKTTKSVG